LLFSFPPHLAGSHPDNKDVTDLFVLGVDGTEDSGVDEEVGEFGSVSRSLDYKKPDSDSNLDTTISIGHKSRRVGKLSTHLAIFSSSLSLGSTCKLRSYISCTSPALFILFEIYSCNSGTGCSPYGTF
jgi:hypothetical protein